MEVLANQRYTREEEPMPKKAEGASGKADELKQILADFAMHRQAAVVSLLLPREPLVNKWALRLRRALAGKSFDKVDLLIHSGGGDINVAYQIVELLRMHSKVLRAVVPLYAKSAATLLCLGADEIVVDELAQLGPLDTQIVEERKGGQLSFASALNPFKTLEQLRQFSLETLDIAVKLIVSRCPMNPDEALDHATKFVGAITSPLFAQLSPEKLGEYSRALSVGTEYGERLLRRYSKIPEANHERLLERLVHGYPSHEYIIDYHEAVELGLPVKLFTDGERDLADRLLKAVPAASDDLFIVEPPSAQPPNGESAAATEGESHE
jgi:hypothetical protein